MNTDYNVCEYDLFSAIKNANDSVFIYAIHQDFKDILYKIQSKAQLQQGQSHPFEEWNNLRNSFEIKNIEKYLREKQKIQDIKGSFLSIFNPKNTGPVQLTSVYESADNKYNNDEAAENPQNISSKNFNPKSQPSGSQD